RSDLGKANTPRGKGSPGTGSGNLGGDGMGGAFYPVVRVQVNQVRLVTAQFRFIVLAIGGDNNPVPHLYFARRGSVHGHGTGTGFGENNIGGKALAIVDV